MVIEFQFKHDLLSIKHIPMFVFLNRQVGAYTERERDINPLVFRKTTNYNY